MNFGTFREKLSSVGKVIEESASSAAKAGYAIASNELLLCFQCSASISATQLSLGLVTYEQCRMCGKKFCVKCISKLGTENPIPQELLYRDYQDKATIVNWVCHQCEPKFKSRLMEIFQQANWTEIEKRITEYLAGREQLIKFYDLPKPSEDSYTRQVERFAQVAEYMADMAGYSLMFRAVKYAYYSKELYAMLIAGDILNVLGPVAGELEKLGARKLGSKGVLQLYYLSCIHKLELKINPLLEHAQYGECIECNETLLDLIGSYMDLSQYLYSAALPKPHNSSDWACWYLTNLVRKQNWTVLTCTGDTTKLMNDVKCPAFALLVRSLPVASSSTSEMKREAVLIIRGSKAVMDWSINLSEDPVEFTYYQGNDMTAPVTGWAHSGMLDGALGILDNYSMRQSLLRLLLDHNYSVTVVGHSLGAGTAALIAADFKNGIVKSGRALKGIPKIQAIAYATPPCTSEELADALAADELVITTINGFDIVPRFSKVNMIGMLEEIKATGSKTDEWYNQDYIDVRHYVSTMGRAGNATNNQRTYDSVPAGSASSAAAGDQSVLNSGTDKDGPDKDSVSDNTGQGSTLQSLSKMAGSYFTKTSATTGQVNKPSPSSVVVASSSTSSASFLTPSPVVATVVPNPSNSMGTVVGIAPPPAIVTAELAATGNQTIVTPVKPAKPPRASIVGVNPTTVTGTIATSSNVGTVTVSATAVPAGATVASNSEITESNGSADDGVADSSGGDQGIEFSACEGAVAPRLLVPPGKIIQIFSIHGEHKAAVITHRHTALRRILLLDDRSVADHDIDVIANNIRRIKFGLVLKRNGVRRQIPPIWQSIETRPPNTDLESTSLHKTLSISATASSLLTLPSVQSAVAHSESTIEEVSAATCWTRCAVCELDPTWPYILKGDAHRGHTVHNCRSCGRVVCTICSPSGDTICGDGISSKVTLLDKRIPLPSLGLLEPQRVCMHCYFASYRQMCESST